MIPSPPARLSLPLFLLGVLALLLAAPPGPALGVAARQGTSLDVRTP